MRSLKISKEVELIIAGIGVAQSIYLSLYGMLSKQRDFKNILLSLFFLSITFRIIKSLLWVYLEETPLWIINSGFWAHSVSGPLLYLYVYYFIYNKHWQSKSWFHFIPSVILLFMIPYLNLGNFWYLGGYSVLLYHQMAYCLLSIFVLFSGYRNRRNLDRSHEMNRQEWLWISILVFGILCLQTAYYTNYILGLTPYLLGPVVYAAIVYFLSFFVLKNQDFLNRIKNQKKYRNIKISGSEIKMISQRIQQIMRHQKPYKDTSYQMKHLSKTLGLQPYLVSHVVNTAFSQNFSDYINSYRVEEAKKMLEDADYSTIKISVIAYECGFNSLSSFNQSFRRHTKMTPSEYRNSLMNL